MSVIVQIMTSDDDAEILRCLDMLKKSTGGLGLMHESGNFPYPLFSRSFGLFFLAFALCSQYLADGSKCEEGEGLYEALVCMGEWIVWGDDLGLD